MNEQTSPDDMARMALAVFRHFGSRPKDSLRADNFATFAPRRGWSPEHLMAGVEHGKTLGWFEDGPNESVRLTSTGFDQIERTPTHS